jgi:exodeoxyribonuclease VII large subunit
MQTTTTGNPPARDIYTVTRLNREARAVLEGSFPTIWIQGEISNLARPGSGHLYFSLKDSGSQVRCAMFKGQNRYIKFNPENGMEILARAAVSLYEGRGEFQLIIEYMEPAGAGALQRAFEELKQILDRKGLFDPAHKRPLPGFPAVIGVITSPTGAAIRDILQVLRRRYPLAGVIVYPVPVQGAGAAELIARTIALADQRSEVDVIILARGGGSLEDLWSFNSEGVARAIYQCRIPVITGIGHEIDFTIADFVADQRAPTPSVAAEIAVPNRSELLRRLDLKSNRLMTMIKQGLENHGRHLRQLEKRLPDPVRQFQHISQRLDDTGSRLRQSFKLFLTQRQQSVLRLTARLNACHPLQVIRLVREKTRHCHGRLRQAVLHELQRHTAHVEQLTRALQTISPLATLARGYAIVTHNDTILRNANAVNRGDLVKARLAQGNLYSRVTDIETE